jgi:feruloyl esterase
VDWFATLIDWVENGKAPERLVATKKDESGEVTLSRPVYPYPLRASYKGSGSTDDAESFVLEQP